MSFQGLYQIRAYKPEDKAFVLATFLRGSYYGNPWLNLIPKQIYMENYSFIAQKMIENPRTNIKIACLPDEPDVILGYSILSYNDTVVDWVYIKRSWRGQGIMKSLIPQEPASVSHLSEIGKQMLETTYKTTIFNPFTVR